MENIDLWQELVKSREIVKSQPQAHECYNHAMLCAEFGLWEEATEVLTTANEMIPECPVIARYLSIGLLKLGKIREGLQLFERRFEHPIPDGPPCLFGYTVGARLRDRYRKPYWDGKTDIQGKTLYLFSEGGYGDVLQNIRFLPRLQQICGKVILEVNQELVKLLQGISGVDEIVPCGTMSQMLFFNAKQNVEKIALADYVLSLHSLMYYFDPDLVNIPWKFPYITPKFGESPAIKIVRECKARVKLGIVWAGKPGHGNDNRRTALMKQFLPLKNIPGVQLFSLQKGEMRRSWGGQGVDLVEGGEVLESIDLAPMLQDFNDTALVLKELDALVSVDTSVTHLAGALNVPVWTALPTKEWAEWRWQREWYLSQKKRYQQKDGDWHDLINTIADEITKEI